MLHNSRVSSQYIYTFLTVILLACLSGCANSGSLTIAELTQEDLSYFVQKGSTDDKAILRELGDPSDISLTGDGLVIWTYDYSRVSPRAQNFIPYLNVLSSVKDVARKKLVILFDDNHLVKNYAMTDSQEVIRAGLFE